MKGKNGKDMKTTEDCIKTAEASIYMQEEKRNSYGECEHISLQEAISTLESAGLESKYLVKSDHKTTNAFYGGSCYY